MKNVVIIHLESLNSAFLYQYSDILPNIMKLKEKSMFFDKYYSTATSTIMTITDLIYGSCACSESSTDLVHLQIEPRCEAWIEQLGTRIRKKHAVIYPLFNWQYDYINMNKIMQPNAKVDNQKKYKGFRESISKRIQELDGDFLYVFDWSSVNLREECECKYTNWSEYYTEQYKRIDDTLGFVMEQLELYHKLDETLIVAFGDHGDDMYSYGKNNGFTHAIAPYPNIIKTPLMLYYPGIGVGVNHALTCTADIGTIVKNIWNGNTGIKKREYVFSRNLFPLQKSKVLEKSFSVTDGEYLLLISSKGLEMYLCRFMSQGIFNLLNWFRLGKDGTLLLEKRENMHFQRMIYDQKTDIEIEFDKLRKILYREMKQLVNKGLLDEKIKWWFTKIHYDCKE